MVHSLVHSPILVFLDVRFARFASVSQLRQARGTVEAQCRAEARAFTQNSGGTVAGRRENLKPWKPGQSGNPGGRPKRDVAAEIARAIFEGDADAIKRVFAKQLRKGNYKVFAALADRAYGKPRQSFDLSAGDGEDSPACIRVEFVKSGFKELSE